MRYYVATLPEVAAYLSAVEGLSEAGRDAVIDAYTDELGRDADTFLDNHPTGHESLHFRYDYYLADSGLYHQFDFVVDGTQMAVGVVTVVLVEHTAEPLDDLL